MKWQAARDQRVILLSTRAVDAFIYSKAADNITYSGQNHLHLMHVTDLFLAIFDLVYEEYPKVTDALHGVFHEPCFHHQSLYYLGEWSCYMISTTT